MKIVRIADIGEIITGHTPPTKERDYYGNLYPLLKPTDMRLNERYSPPTEESVSAKWVAIKKKTLIPRHATCVVTIGTIGKICIASGPCFTNQAVNSVIPDRTRYDEMYIYYLLKTVVPHVKHLSSGTASGRENVSKSAFSNIEVNVHDLPTQRKIASILSAYDDLIENNTRRIAILEEMAQAIYREWFVNYRFPRHENVKLVESALGMIPEGWEVVTLKEMYPTSSGGTPSRTKDEYYSGGTINWVKTKELKDRFLWNTEEKITELGLKNSSAKVYPKHTVLMAMYGATIGKLAILGSEAATNQACCAFRIHESDFGYPFLFFYLLRNRNEIISLGAGAAQQNVSQDVIREIELVKPPLKLVQLFNELVSPTLEQIFTLQKVASNLRITRDLLLPKLISGQLDVEELDIDMGITAEETGEPNAKPVERRPAVRATANDNGASPNSSTHASDPIPIDELDVDQVMAEFRQQARRLGTATRGELLKAVSQELGHKRLGHNIEEALKGHLRAAIRRKIIATYGELVCLHTPSMETYERDELIDAFHSVMRKNLSYEREDVIRSLANHLGFRRLTDTVREPIKSAINAAIRRGVLDYKGELIWRAD